MTRIALTLVLLLALAGCSAGGDEVAGPVPATSPATAADAGDPLAFAATTVQGEPVDGSSYAGQDLMVWFWAPW